MIDRLTEVTKTVPPHKLQVVLNLATLCALVCGVWVFAETKNDLVNDAARGRSALADTMRDADKALFESLTRTNLELTKASTRLESVAELLASVASRTDGQESRLMDISERIGRIEAELDTLKERRN